jgi:nucleoside-diphosphate-sugar epimerase
MKALVFGSGGYAGRRVFASLLEHHVDVVGVDITPLSKFVHERCDIAASGEVSSLLYRVRPDVVINLGYALAAASSAHPQRALRVNILGVNEIFETAHNLRTPRVISVSSGAVYGDNADHDDGAIVDEETIRTPRTLYGHMKSLNEAFAEHYNALGRTTIVSLRLPTLHGRGKTGMFAPLDMIVEAARARRPLTLPWSREQRFCFIHVDDAARAIVELALAPAPRWTTYNTGGREMSIGDLINLAEPICGISIDTEEPGVSLLNVSRVSGDRLADEFVLERDSVEDWLRFELSRSGAADGVEAST